MERDTTSHAAAPPKARQKQRGKVKRTRGDKEAARASSHYHVGDYGLRGDTLGNAKRRVGGVSCHATNMGSDHLCRTLP